MKRHIKGFNIIRLLLACVIGIGAMNIGLISADDTRLVDEEAVKIEEVMSISDDVSVISSGLLQEALDGMTEGQWRAGTDFTMGRGNVYNKNTTFVDIYYNGRLWGQTSAYNTKVSTTTNILLYNGATNTAKPVYSTMTTETLHASGFTLNAAGTLTWTPANNDSYGCYYTYISLTGTMDFGWDTVDTPAEAYTISKGSASNGSFVVASSAYADTTVTVGTTPNTGYKLNSVSVPGASNIIISGNNATFTMPEVKL